jgi:spermidine dehydrogenase
MRPVRYFEAVQLDPQVSIGDYKCPRTPEEPIVVHLMKTSCHPGLSARDIAAITVNRWPHGYAYEHNSLRDPFASSMTLIPCGTSTTFRLTTATR